MKFVYAILILTMLTACSANTNTQQVELSGSFQHQANESLAALHENGQFHGTVLVADGDKIIYEASFGEADMSWGIANTSETKFRIASVTKQFTAALILQLYEADQIDLDAPITVYLPDYPAQQGKQITINHLLSHRAGVPNYTGLPDWDDWKRDSYKPQDFIKLFWELDLKFEPGSQFNYSNSNYFILGVIIEAVTGQTYADAVEQRVLAPLGLTNTGYHRHDRIVPNLARGYVRHPGGYQPEEFYDVSLPYAAGMLYSTGRDLHRWKRALHSGAVFQNLSTLQLMLMPPNGEEFGYAKGIGLNMHTFGDVSTLVTGHGGRIEAFQSDDRYLPTEELTMIVLSNTGSDVGEIGTTLLNLWLSNPSR